MDTLQYIGIAQAVFVAFFMLCKRPNILSDKLVAAWMIFLASPMLFRLGSVAYSDLFISRLFSIKSIPLTFGPFLWLYTNTLIGQKHRITKKDLVHFSPFMIFALFQIVFQSPPPAPPPPVLPADALPPFLFKGLNDLANPFSSCCYSGLVLWKLKSHRQNTLNYFSSLPLHVTLTWLHWLTIGFVCSFLLPLINFLWPVPQLSLAHTLSFTGFIYVLSFFGLKQPLVFQMSERAASAASARSADRFEGAPLEPTAAPAIKRKLQGYLFRRIRPSAAATAIILRKKNSCSFEEDCYQAEPEQEKEDKTTEENQGAQNARSDVTEELLRNEKPAKETEGQKYERSGLTDERARVYLQRLEEYMQQEKPYLEADLTIETLAKRLHISRHHLTQVLNEELERNFYLYVNDYRIKEIKQRLLDPDNAHLTILAIAYESGFNSKSTFNTAFKKITHMTPSQFRKSQVRA